MPDRVKPWIFWAILYAALYAAIGATLICSVLAYQMIRMKEQNRLSIADRAYLHARQQETIRTLALLDERSDYLDKTIRGLIKADHDRQDRRKAEAKK